MDTDKNNGIQNGQNVSPKQIVMIKRIIALSLELCFVFRLL